jgi:hypothetical protein
MFKHLSMWRFHMTKLNRALMATTAIAFAAGLAMPAAAKKKDPSKAPKVVASGAKMKLKLYGQIARTASINDNGAGVGFANSENGNTSTRMGIRAAGKINNDLKINLRYEFNARSAHENQQTERVNGDNDFDIRYADIAFKHKRFGTVWFGRGQGSGDSSSQTDLSGTSTGAKGGGEHWDFQGAEFLESKESAAGDVRIQQAVGDSLTNMDATGRSDRIRYDSPSIYGFQFRTALIQQDAYEFALWYKGKIAGMRVRAAINRSHGAQQIFGGADDAGLDAGDELTIYNGSISVRSPWGIGVSGSAGTSERHRVLNVDGTGAGSTEAGSKTAHYWWAAVFYRAKFFELGETRFRYGFNQVHDNVNEGDIAETHGFTIVQQIKSTGTDAYVGYRHASLETDEDTTNGGNQIEYNDVQQWVLGFRARF